MAVLSAAILLQHLHYDLFDHKLLLVGVCIVFQITSVQTYIDLSYFVLFYSGAHEQQLRRIFPFTC